jgi:hypothetical protein
MSWQSDSEADQQYVTAARHRRNLRDRKTKQEEEVWTRDDFAHDLARVSSPIMGELDANPADAARLRKAREQVKEGEVHWGLEDEDDASDQSDAGD